MTINSRLHATLILSASISTLVACSSSDDDSDSDVTPDNGSNSVVLFDEATDGDIIGDPNNPQPLQLATGVNSISASVVAGDVDYVTINVPAGSELTAIELIEYISTNDVSFIGIQAGSVFTELPADPAVENLLGQTLFGTEMVGSDILGDLGNGVGAQGFTPPLQAGDYTFWIQETSEAQSDYSLGFVVETSN